MGYQDVVNYWKDKGYAAQAQEVEVAGRQAMEREWAAWRAARDLARKRGEPNPPKPTGLETKAEEAMIRQVEIIRQREGLPMPGATEEEIRAREEYEHAVKGAGEAAVTKVEMVARAEGRTPTATELREAEQKARARVQAQEVRLTAESSMERARLEAIAEKEKIRQLEEAKKETVSVEVKETPISVPPKKKVLPVYTYETPKKPKEEPKLVKVEHPEFTIKAPKGGEIKELKIGKEEISWKETTTEKVTAPIVETKPKTAEQKQREQWKAIMQSEAPTKEKAKVVAKAFTLGVKETGKAVLESPKLIAGGIIATTQKGKAVWQKLHKKGDVVGAAIKVGEVAIAPITGAWEVGKKIGKEIKAGEFREVAKDVGHVGGALVLTHAAGTAIEKGSQWAAQKLAEPTRIGAKTRVKMETPTEGMKASKIVTQDILGRTKQYQEVSKFEIETGQPSIIYGETIIKQIGKDKLEPSVSVGFEFKVGEGISAAIGGAKGPKTPTTLFKALTTTKKEGAFISIGKAGKAKFIEVGKILSKTSEQFGGGAGTATQVGTSTTVLGTLVQTGVRALKTTIKPKGITVPKTPILITTKTTARKKTITTTKPRTTTRTITRKTTKTPIITPRRITKTTTTTKRKTIKTPILKITPKITISTKPTYKTTTKTKPITITKPKTSLKQLTKTTTKPRTKTRIKPTTIITPTTRTKTIPKTTTLLGISTLIQQTTSQQTKIGTATKTLTRTTTPTPSPSPKITITTRPPPTPPILIFPGKGKKRKIAKRKDLLKRLSKYTPSLIAVGKGLYGKEPPKKKVWLGHEIRKIPLKFKKKKRRRLI